MSSRREISSRMRSSVVRGCDIDWAMRLYNIFKEGGLEVKRGGHVMYPVRDVCGSWAVEG